MRRDAITRVGARGESSDRLVGSRDPEGRNVLSYTARQRLLAGVREFFEADHYGSPTFWLPYVDPRTGESEERGYQPDVRWKHEGYDSDANSTIAFELTPTNVLKLDEQPINNTLEDTRRVDPARDPVDVPPEHGGAQGMDLVEMEGERVYDVLNCTVEADGASNGMAARDRAQGIAEQLHYYFRWYHDQNYPGTRPGEVPVLVKPIEGRGVTNVSGVLESGTAAQFDFGVELHHTVLAPQYYREAVRFAVMYDDMGFMKPGERTVHVLGGDVHDDATASATFTASGTP